MERKELQIKLQEAAVELERAINKGRKAAEEGLKDASIDPNSTFKEFDMWYRYQQYFEALHKIKLIINSDILFKNYKNF